MVEVPRTCRDQSAPPHHAAHLRQASHGVRHERHDELGRRQVEDLVAERQLLGRTVTDVDLGEQRPHRQHEARRRVHGRELLGSQPVGEDRRQRARPAADVERPVAGRGVEQVDELPGERLGEPAHEAGVGVRRDVESHPRTVAPSGGPGHHGGMRGERDFEAYATARGAAVVRGLLLLGLDLPEAEDTAAAALGSLRSDWRDVGRAADPDVVLWATVLAVDARRRHRRREPPAADGLVAQALRGPAGLEELQACEVLGVSVPRLRALLATVAPETDEVDGPSVLAVPYARVRAVSVQRRRRTWLLTAGVVAVTVLVVGLAYQVSRPEPVLRPGDDLPAVATTQQDNPSEVVWWADGTLHLADAAVEVGDVQRLVAAGRGAAYVDGDGRLVAVTPDGHRTLLGRPTARSSLVSSPRLGLVAWTDDSVPDEPRIVVWDVDAGERVSGVVTSPRARTITFDGGWLTFGTGLTDWAWDPHGGHRPGDRQRLRRGASGADRARRRRRRHPAGAARLLPPRGARREGARRGGPRLRRDAVAGRPAGAGRRRDRHRALAVRRPDRRRPRHSVPGRVARPRRHLRLRRPGRLVGRPGRRGPPDRHVQPRGVHRRGASPRDRAPR